jgi:hypothetical protein
MILYCMTPHGLQCLPNYLQTFPSLKEKQGEDPANHIMTFHLWCSSNNIMDDSIRLRLFQRTLTGPSTKWYVEEKSGSHVTFESLAKAFLTFFQLPIHHDNGLELLSEFKQTSATHIADHIHEWHRRRSLCKAETTKEQCLNWFLKSLVSLLAKDVASTFPQSEEEAISKAQQFDLIYAQSGYLYTVLPDAPQTHTIRPGQTWDVSLSRWIDWYHNTPQSTHPTTTYVWYTPISTDIWRTPLLSSSPLSTTIPCCPSSTHEWTPTTPMMRPLTSQPSSGTPSTSAYTLSTSESTTFLCTLWIIATK